MNEKRWLHRLWTIIRWIVPLGLIAFLLTQVNWQEILSLLVTMAVSLLGGVYLLWWRDLLADVAMQGKQIQNELQARD